ncbi:hypothetical protein Tco_0766650 [Tanacetum coccineum]
MRDENPIRTLGDYSKPSHEGHRNTIELPEGNNVVPLRSDTIRLVQNGCSFHGLRSEDPNQHLKDFLKLVDSLDLNVANRERTRLIAKLRNNIMMFQQHQGESLSEAWIRFQDLLQKVPHHGIDRWLLIQIFYDHEIIENLALYDHEGWNDSKDSIKPVKAIVVSPNASKTHDQRLLELEEQINFMLKGPQPIPKTSSTHIPQADVKAVSSSPLPRDLNELPRQNSFTFHECVHPNPQPQALETSFEDRVRDYMATHAKIMERFENAIFKQREEINDKMAEMFGLLKELIASRTPEKEEKNIENNGPNDKSVVKPRKSDEEESPKGVDMKNEVERKADDGPAKSARENVTRNEEDEPARVSSSYAVGYYLKHRINEKLIEGLVENQRFNDSLSATRVGKKKRKTYNLLPRGPVHDAILKKKITRKEDIGGNVEMPCNVGGLKNILPYLCVALTKFYIDGGFVEFVHDLGNTYTDHHKCDKATGLGETY